MNPVEEIFIILSRMSYDKAIGVLVAVLSKLGVEGQVEDQIIDCLLDGFEQFRKVKSPPRKAERARQKYWNDQITGR